MAKTITPTNRRNFLKGAAGGTVATGALAGGMPLLAPGPATAQSASGSAALEMRLTKHPTIAAEPGSGSEAFWQEVRQAFPLPENYIHMNTGTTGSQPTFAQNNLAVYNHYKSANPRDWRENIIAEFSDLFPTGEDGSTAIDDRQAAVAAMYGANDDEIVLSYNTSDACNMIFAGTPWQPGDRIVTTNLEHPAMLGPIRWARDYQGVEVVVVPVSKEFNDNDAITVADAVALFEPAMSEPLGDGNKQYLAISEITYKNGLRLPVKELVEMARRNGGYSIIDSAHAWGMLPVNCHARLRRRLHRRRGAQVAVRRARYGHLLRPQPRREPAALRDGQLLPLQRGLRRQPRLEPCGSHAGARRVQPPRPLRDGRYGGLLGPHWFGKDL